jgi:hypothetical protein
MPWPPRSTPSHRRPAISPHAGHGDARAAWASRHAAIDAQTRHKAAVLRRTAQRIAQYADDIARADVDAARAVIGI